MKKTILSLSLAVSTTIVSAANFASVDVESVKDSNGNKSTAQYVRVGKDMGGLNLGLQVRTATLDSGGMLNSVEGTVGKSVNLVGLPISAYAGVGHDNGLNGGTSYQYGVVGVNTGFKVGPLWAYTGAKTRVNWDSANPSQTLGFAGISYNLSKDVSVNAGVSKSWGDIKETTRGLGLRVNF